MTTATILTADPNAPAAGGSTAAPGSGTTSGGAAAGATPPAAGAAGAGAAGSATPPAAGVTSPPATPPAAGEKKPDAPAAVAAPAKYEFTLPEGFKAESVAEVEALARKLDLPQDKAQALLDHQAATVKTFVEGQRAELTQLANTWHDQVKADPKLGGANFEKTQIDARKALQRFGDQELVTALHETGYTNFPPLVRFVAAIGAAIGEDGIVRGAAPASDKSLGEIFYPNMTKKS